MEKRLYRLEFTAQGPIHIGNGNKYGKKDYFQSSKKIAVLDVKRFAARLAPNQLDDYCSFLSGSSREGDLQTYLEKNNLMDVANDSVAYFVESSLATAKRGSVQYHEVFEFVKDPFGNPYVPGSSVKGMLRTAMLNSLALNDKSLVQSYDAQLACDGQGCKKADKKLMKKAFWVEQPDENQLSIANDIMKYVSVSDSRPLSCSDLVFVKKYDLFSRKDDCSHKPNMGKRTDTHGNALNIYRECLRPGAIITVDIDIDSQIDKYLPFLFDVQGIEQVFLQSYELYKKHFLDSYDVEDPCSSNEKKSDGRCQYIIASGPLAGSRCRNHAVDGTLYCSKHQQEAIAGVASKNVTCYLGGGIDFDSKTVVNALFSGSEKRLFELAHILYAQFPTKIDRGAGIRSNGDLAREVEEAGYGPRNFKAVYRNGRLVKAKEDHRHWRDVELGVSPHTMKLGILDGKKLPMGKCSLSIKER